MAQDPATGEVLRFDPCRPLHYVVRAGLEPPGGARTLDAAVQELSKGNRWAPVLIASTPAESAELAGDVDGYAGPQVGFDGRQHLVSGQVVLDAAQLTTPAGALSPAAYPTALHELAHLVGLGHVQDPQQLMYPQLLRQQQFGMGEPAGSRAGRPRALRLISSPEQSWRQGAVSLLLSPLGYSCSLIVDCTRSPAHSLP